MQLNDAPQETQLRFLCDKAGKAIRFSGLDRVANTARGLNLWSQCVDTIHDRNMVMLGKTRQGYSLAVWKKGFHEVIVENEHTIIKGKAVHVRQLCQRGYKFIPVRRLNDE